MKKLLPPLVTILILAIIALLVVSRARQVKHITVHKGNTQRVPVEILIGHHQDTQCGMTLDQLEDTAQAVAPDGRTWFFDDVGCLALWLGKHKNADEMMVWVYTRDSAEWIDGRLAWYSRTAKTTMGFGFAAHREAQPGFISFDDMVNRMLRGENLTNPYIRKELLG